MEDRAGDYLSVPVRGVPPAGAFVKASTRSATRRTLPAAPAPLSSLRPDAATKASSARAPSSSGSTRFFMTSSSQCRKKKSLAVPFIAPQGFVAQMGPLKILYGLSPARQRTFSDGCLYVVVF